MHLARPTVSRAALMATVVAACVLLPAGAALAHNGTGGTSSDYRIQISGFEGDPTGIRLRVVELGNRLELQRTSATTVMVLGYEGEPYLRLDATGVAENVNSPAHYLNLDRFASVNPPASASATAVPSWTMISTGASVRWHDHRAHWMSSTPRADVLADPDVQRVIFYAKRIDLVVDGRTVTALVRVTWLPTPLKYVWLGVATVLGLAAAAVLVLDPRGEKLVPSVALIGAVAALVGQGASATRHWMAAAAIAVALFAVVVRSPLLAVGAAAAAGLLAVTRIEAFEHELLAGGPGVVQRVALVVAMMMCLGVVAAAIVGALEPTPAPALAAAVGVDE